nr:LPS export ABC transporter permease LptF [Frigidibacter albus]
MLSQLLTLFGFFSLVLVSVYWINQAVRLFEQLIADGQSAWVFLEFSLLTLPNVIRMVLPVSAFAAAVYVTNRLSAESELVVMQATGFSPWRLARPALAFGLIVALLLSVLTHVLVPASRTGLAERRTEIAENITAQFLVDGSFQHPAAGITLYIREITLNGELLDIYLSDARAETQTTTYTAERALLIRAETGPKLVMFEGMAQTLQAEGNRLFVTRFDDFTYDIGALITEAGTRRRDLREFSTQALLFPTPDLMEITRQPREVFLAEGHSRFAQPLTAAIFAVIGFSALLTGSFSRFGVWRQIGVAVVLLIVVQMLANVGASAAQSDEALWPLVYLPVVVGSALTAGLLWLAARPRRIGGRRGPVAEAAA